MALKVTNGGELDIMQAALNIAPAEDLVLKLFKNNKVPADADVVADYTEADFVGYAPVPLDASDWAITPGNPTVAEQPVVPFVSTGGGQNQPVYGYYIEGADSGQLKWAERFTDGPYNIVNVDDEIKIVPRFTGQSES